MCNITFPPYSLGSAIKKSKSWLVCGFIALLTACGSQEGGNTDVDSTNTASAATVTIAKSAPAASAASTPATVDLLASLAAAYPNGQLSAERAAVAAVERAQNPAVLGYTAPVTPVYGQNSSQSLSFNPNNILSMAAGSYTLGLSMPVQRVQNTTLSGSYFFSISPTETTTALATNPTWNLEGTAFHAYVGIQPGTAAVYRFRNLLNGSYLYTIDDTEKNTIVANYSSTFVLEGPAWFSSPAPAAGYNPLYRFQNLTNGTYLFSAYESEKDAIIANYPQIFKFEGISYYVRQKAPLELSLIAGSGVSGALNGTGATASFTNIYGTVHDSAGNMFATDYNNHTIRKITPTGVVTTHAGAAGVYGNTDGALLDARFALPNGIAIDASDNLFVADAKNHTIRKITPAGVVSTFAGTAVGGVLNFAILNDGSYLDAQGVQARFNGPRGLVFDSLGNLFVVDRYNNAIRKITPDGFVSTFAGMPGFSGSTNGIGSAARFNIPVGITIDSSDNMFVTDGGNKIRKITSSAVVTTVAGSATGLAGNVDGVGSAARFNFPYGITNDGAGNLYVADHNNFTIRKVDAVGNVTTVAGDTSTTFLEGLLPASFGQQLTQSVHIYGGQLYISSNKRIVKINGLP